VLGAWCLVLGAWCLVLGAWCLVPVLWLFCTDAWCLFYTNENLDEMIIVTKIECN